MLLPIFNIVLDPSISETSQYGPVTVILTIFTTLNIDLNLRNILLLITVFFTLKGVFTFVSWVYVYLIQADLGKRLRERLFHSYKKNSLDQILSYQDGYLVNLSDQQVTLSLEVFNAVCRTVSYAINLLVFSIGVFFLNKFAGLFSLSAGALLILLFSRISFALRSISRKTVAENTALSTTLVQFFSCIKYFKVVSDYSLIERRFDNSTVNLREYNLRSGVLSSIAISVREPLAVMSIMILIILDLYITQQGLSSLLVTIVFMHRALNAGLNLQKSVQSVFLRLGSFDEVMTELNRLNRPREQINEAQIGINDIQTITINGVDISKTDRPVALITKQFHKGSLNLICGKTGTGKSSLLMVLCGIAQPKSGEVLVNNEPIRALEPTIFRKQIGYVPQTPFFLNGSVLQNVFMNNHECISQQDRSYLEVLLKEFELSELIPNIDKDLNYLKTLSGGQIQRLSIIREILKNPELLLLDEPTSSVDSLTAHTIMRFLTEFKKNKIVILVSHDMQFRHLADTITLIENIDR